jgi:hypothetical protein
VAATLVGASGLVAGVIAAEDAESFETPAPLLAFTTKVYEVPLSKPETVQLVPDVVQVDPPGDAVAV